LRVGEPGGLLRRPRQPFPLPLLLNVGHAVARGSLLQPLAHAVESPGEVNAAG